MELTRIAAVKPMDTFLAVLPRLSRAYVTVNALDILTGTSILAGRHTRHMAENLQLDFGGAVLVDVSAMFSMRAVLA